MDEIRGHGKKPNQKLKPYIVLQYLLRNTDEEHVASAADIVAFLEEDCGIAAERRSIYRDIDDINKISYMLENGCDIHEAEEVIAADEYGADKLVIYDKSKRGFYVQRRRFELDDMRLLAECVYSSKFIPQGQAERLVDVVCEFVSEHQAEKIKHDAFLADRVKTTNKGALNNLNEINSAMSRTLDGQKHIPEKISFKYLKYTISDTRQQTERRHGERYIVSPFKLLINDGNYYLLAFDGKGIKTYRVDRMKDVRRTGEEREGAEVFSALDVESYARRAFGMFSGNEQRVTIQFVNSLLDTAVERFGNSNVIYRKVDSSHFSVTATVSVSEQFFAWVFGFGKRARLISPPPIVEQFKDYLDKVRKIYE